MGTTDALLAAAAAAVALLALATLAMLRARTGADRRLHAALGQIGDSVSHLTETLGALAVRAATPEIAADVTGEIAVSLDPADIADSLARAAGRLPGVDAAAMHAVLENGDAVVGTVGVPKEAVGRLALDPPDASRYGAVHVHWGRPDTDSPVGGSAPPALNAALAVPVEDRGVRVGTLLAFSRQGSFPPETESGLLRLASSSAPAVVNARRYHATLDLVRTDALTGLRNRRAYDDELSLEIERARRGETPLSLLVVDLDDFGQVNKTFSLQVGDLVLSTFAGVLRSTARTVDVVCRRGGEEFAIVLPDTGCIEAQRFCGRLRHEVSFTQFPTIGRLTFSAGLTELRPDDTAATIDERASRLMNESKRAGKDRVTHDCS